MSANQPICKSCSVPWVDHLGIQGTCAENSQLRKERDEIRQRVENIKNGFEGGCYLCEVVGEMNKKLQQERDEARREVCKLHVLYSRFYHAEEEKECAKDRGWDCFKEEETP
jgi:uncharacterized coiled-coil DUF342 family protein